MAEAAAPQFREEGLFEYHLYTLERPTTLLENEKKQVTLLEASGVPLQEAARLPRRAVVVPLRDRRRVGRTQKVARVPRVREQGRGERSACRCRRASCASTRPTRAAAGSSSARTRSTTRRATRRCASGWATRSTSSAIASRWTYKVLGSCRSESAWQIDLRNHKDSAVEVDVIEPASGDWEIVASSQKADEGRRADVQLRRPGAGERQHARRVPGARALVLALARTRAVLERGHRRGAARGRAALRDARRRSRRRARARPGARPTCRCGPTRSCSGCRRPSRS